MDTYNEDHQTMEQKTISYVVIYKIWEETLIPNNDRVFPLSLLLNQNKYVKKYYVQIFGVGDQIQGHTYAT